MASPPTAFALPDNKSRATRKPFLVYGRILQGGLVAVFGAFILGEALLRGPTSQHDWFEVALGASVMVVGVVGAVVIARISSWKPPSTLSVDESGLSLAFPDGHTVRMGWTDPKTKFRVTDYRSPTLPKPADPEGSLSFGSHSVRLTGAALDAVIARAWSMAGAVFVRRWPRSNPTFGDIVGWDIRGDPSARPQSAAWQVPIERSRL